MPEEHTERAEYVRCEDCKCWITNDREWGWIDIHGRPHVHEKDLFGPVLRK